MYGESQNHPAEHLSILDVFSPYGIAAINVAALSAGEFDPLGLSISTLPLLVIPADGPALHSANSQQLVIAVKGSDNKMAAHVSALFDPSKVKLALVHVTWVPGLATSPVPPQGIDNPQPIDLLVYRGAHGALISEAQALRDSGFSVSTHLREGRHPAKPLLAEIERLRAALVILGLGRHGAGIGRELWHEMRLPILFLNGR